MIEITGLTKYFSGSPAVKNLSLTIEPGQVVCFLGVNGAGKTTTLRILSGILVPDSGTVKIEGHDLLSGDMQARRFTGYIPDRPFLYPRLTAQEHLIFCGSLFQLPREYLYARINLLLDEFSLTKHAHELTEGFSHGMKQRLAICASLLHEPRFLVVDEPLVGLDPHGARHLKNYLRKLAEAGTAILLSTHLLDLAEELAGRVAIIHRGELLKIGSLAEIRGDKSLEHVFLALTAEQEDT